MALFEEPTDHNGGIISGGVFSFSFFTSLTPPPLPKSLIDLTIGPSGGCVGCHVGHC
jgi:hypothetical protein